ncbi:TPA: hypothetical protein ACTL7U_006433, partial [Pseudomonas aeruginosa]
QLNTWVSFQSAEQPLLGQFSVSGNTVHSKRGGNWDDEGNYNPSGHESMCAGAAAYLMKKGRPTVGMRFAFATGDAAPGDWDSAREVVID